MLTVSIQWKSIWNG